jgi:gluconokinase
VSVVVIVMGVSGSGKTTVGRAVAEKTGWPYFDADDYHSSANIAKMHAGTPLMDEDRKPWLDQLHALIQTWLVNDTNAILGCSALTAAYRKRLGADTRIRWVYLKADRALLAERLRRRTGHFMNPTLLDSQLLTLEEPADALVLDASQSPAALADEIIANARRV